MLWVLCACGTKNSTPSVWLPELQQSSLKILKERSGKSLLLVRNLYQSSTKLGQEQYQAAYPKLVSYTSTCKATYSWIQYQQPSPKIFKESSLQLCWLYPVIVYAKPHFSAHLTFCFSYTLKYLTFSIPNLPYPIKHIPTYIPSILLAILRYLGSKYVTLHLRGFLQYS